MQREPHTVLVSSQWLVHVRSVPADADAMREWEILAAKEDDPDRPAGDALPARDAAGGAGGPLLSPTFRAALYSRWWREMGEECEPTRGPSTATYRARELCVQVADLAASVALRSSHPASAVAPYSPAEWLMRSRRINPAFPTWLARQSELLALAERGQQLTLRPADQVHHLAAAGASTRSGASTQAWWDPMVVGLERPHPRARILLVRGLVSRAFSTVYAVNFD